MLRFRLKYSLLALLFCAFFINGSVFSQPIEVEVGLYILDIAHLDLKESEFFADFYIWYKTPENASWSPKTIEFMNGTIENATPLSHQMTESKKNLWSQRIKGRFRGRFRLHAYPFDQQNLPIIIEDSDYQKDYVVFKPDIAAPVDFAAWTDPGLKIPDWQKSSAEVSVDTHSYVTDFGLETKKATEYSRFTFSLNIKRLFMPHLIKFILPLIIIAGMAYMVFYINASEFETQCGICVTALLSAVALHIAQADALPAVGYLVMSDKIFILFYLVIFSALVQTVINNNYAKRRRFDMAIYLDKKFRIWYVVVLIIGNILVFLIS